MTIKIKKEVDGIVFDYDNLIRRVIKGDIPYTINSIEATTNRIPFTSEVVTRINISIDVDA